MFRIELQNAEGVNFPYYIMGKAQLDISPFTDPWVWIDSQADPYTLFAQEYGVEEIDVGGVEDIWYDWVSQIMSHCPECAHDSLRYCHTRLLPVAQRILPEYLSRWPGIQRKLTELLQETVCEADLASIIQRNQTLFGLLYPDDGREIIRFNHFPTTAQQKPGSHFVFGLGCLNEPERLLQSIESEVGLTLLERVFEDEQVCLLSRQVEAITEKDRYVRGRGSVLEALNNAVRAIEKHGDSVSLAHIPQKPGEQGYLRIVESLFHHRQLYRQMGLRGFLVASLDAIIAGLLT